MSRSCGSCAYSCAPGHAVSLPSWWPEMRSNVCRVPLGYRFDDPPADTSVDVPVTGAPCSGSFHAMRFDIAFSASPVCGTSV